MNLYLHKTTLYESLLEFPIQLIMDHGLEWRTKIATDPQNLQTNKTTFFFYRSSIVKK